MDIAKGYKGFRVEEGSFLLQSWEIKLIWNKKADDKHIALFYDRETLDVFVQALEEKGLRNLTDVSPF